MPRSTGFQPVSLTVREPTDHFEPLNMRYDEFKTAIQTELRRIPAGLTWLQLKERLDLPYARPCPTWIKCMEREIGLSRRKGPTAAHIWKLQPKTNSTPK